MVHGMDRHSMHSAGDEPRTWAMLPGRVLCPHTPRRACSVRVRRPCRCRARAVARERGGGGGEKVWFSTEHTVGVADFLDCHDGAGFDVRGAVHCAVRAMPDTFPLGVSLHASPEP